MKLPSTLCHRLYKQTLKHFLAPACTRLGEHAVIGNLLIQPIIQKPQVIEPLADHLHQLPLTLDVVKEKQEHHFQDHFRQHRFIAVAPVAVRHLLTCKRKIDDRFYLSQRMISSHPLLQIDRVIKELRLALLLSHHDGNTALTDCCELVYYFLLKTFDLGNTPFRRDLTFTFQGCHRFRQNFRISSTWSSANPSRIVFFPLIVTVLAA